MCVCPSHAGMDLQLMRDLFAIAKLLFTSSWK